MEQKASSAGVPNSSNLLVILNSDTEQFSIVKDQITDLCIMLNKSLLLKESNKPNEFNIKELENKFKAIEDLAQTTQATANKIVKTVRTLNKVGNIIQAIADSDLTSKKIIKKITKAGKNIVDSVYILSDAMKESKVALNQMINNFRATDIVTDPVAFINNIKIGKNPSMNGRGAIDEFMQFINVISCVGDIKVPLRVTLLRRRIKKVVNLLVSISRYIQMNIPYIAGFSASTVALKMGIESLFEIVDKLKEDLGLIDMIQMKLVVKRLFKMYKFIIKQFDKIGSMLKKIDSNDLQKTVLTIVSLAPLIIFMAKSFRKMNEELASIPTKTMMIGIVRFGIFINVVRIMLYLTGGLAEDIMNGKLGSLKAFIKILPIINLIFGGIVVLCRAADDVANSLKHMGSKFLKLITGVGVLYIIILTITYAIRLMTIIIDGWEVPGRPKGPLGMLLAIIDLTIINSAISVFLKSSKLVTKELVSISHGGLKVIGGIVILGLTLVAIYIGLDMLTKRVFGDDAIGGFTQKFIAIKLLTKLNKPVSEFLRSSKLLMKSILKATGGIIGGLKALGGLSIIIAVYIGLFKGITSISKILGGSNSAYKVFELGVTVLAISVFNIMFLKMTSTSFGLFKSIGAFIKFGLFYSIAIKGFMKSLEAILVGVIDIIQRIKNDRNVNNMDEAIKYTLKLALLASGASILVKSSHTLFANLSGIGPVSSTLALLSTNTFFSVYLAVALKISQFKKLLEDNGLSTSKLLFTLKDLLAVTFLLGMIVEESADMFKNLIIIGKSLLVRRGARIFTDVFFGEDGLCVKLSRFDMSTFSLSNMVAIILMIISIRQAVVGISSSVRGLSLISKQKKSVIEGVNTLVDIVDNMKKLLTDKKLSLVNWKMYLIQSLNLIVVAGSLYVVAHIFEKIASVTTVAMSIGMWIFNNIVVRAVETLIEIAKNKSNLEKSKVGAEDIAKSYGSLRSIIISAGNISNGDAIRTIIFLFSINSIISTVIKIGSKKKTIEKGTELTEPLCSSFDRYIETFGKLKDVSGLFKIFAVSRTLKVFSKRIAKLGKDKAKIKKGIPIAKELYDLMGVAASTNISAGKITLGSMIGLTVGLRLFTRVILFVGKRKAEIRKSIPITVSVIELFKHTGSVFEEFSNLKAGGMKSVIGIVASISSIIATMVALTLLVGVFKKKIMESKAPMKIITNTINQIKDLLNTMSAINMSDGATNTIICVGVVVAMVFMMSMVGVDSVKKKMSSAALMILSVSITLPVFALSLLLTGVIMRQVDFVGILIAMGYIVGLLGIFVLIGLTAEITLIPVLAAAAMIMIVAGAIMMFAGALLMITTALAKMSTAFIDVEPIKNQVMTIVDIVTLVMTAMMKVPLPFLLIINQKLGIMWGTTFLLGRLMKRIKKIADLGIDEYTVESVRKNVKAAVRAILGIFYDEKGRKTETSVMLDSIDGKITKKLRKLNTVTRKLFRLTRIVTKVANLHYATGWDSEGEPTGYARMQKGDFEKATENMKACVTSILSVFIDENGSETREMLALDHIDNRMKRKTRQLSKIVKFMSEITAIVAETASFKYAVDWNTDGMPTSYKAITKDKLLEATENMKACIATILSPVVTVDKDGNTTETDIMKSLDNIDNRMKRKMRQLGKIVTSMSNIANTVVQYASMKFPRGYDDEGNITGYDTMDSEKFKDAATNMMTCVSTILDMFPTEDKTSAVKTGLKLLLGPSALLMSKLLTGESLNLREDASNNAINKINMIIEPVSKLAQLVINFASAQVPSKWDENGNPIEYALIGKTERDLAVQNISDLFKTLLDSIDKECIKTVAAFNIGVSKDAVDKIVKYITPMTSIADIVLKMASTNIPVKWDANGNPIDYEKIPDDAGTVAAGHIMAVINGLVEGFSKENQKVIKSMKEKTFTNLTMLTEAISPIGDVMKMITDLCTGTTKEYVNGKETGKVIKFSELLSNRNLINQTISNIFNVIDTFISEMGSYVSGENQTKLTSAITGLNSMNKLFKPINDMIGITQKISEMDIDVKKSSTFCQFFNNILSSKFTELNDAQVNSITKTAEAMTKINQSMKDTLANLSNATASENYKKSLEGLGNFVTKINSTSESKLDKMVSISKNLADFSGSIQGNFEKLAEVINEKLVDALEKVEETMNNLTTTIDNKEFNKPEEKEKVKLPQSMQTAGGPSVVPVKKEPDVKVKKPEKERLSIGKLSDCIVNTPDGGVALAVVHLRP